MSKRLKNFAQNYVNDLETKGNAYKSAIKAGYAERYSFGNAHKLVVKGCKYIEKLEKELEERLSLTKDKKLSMIERDIEYFEMQIHELKISESQEIDHKQKTAYKRDIERLIDKRAKLVREHGDLNGDYVIKTEVTQEIHMEKEQDFIDQRIRNALKDN